MTSSAPQWQRALVVLTGTVVGTVVVAALYWAQAVFIPLALAIFLAFLLNPFVRNLQRSGLGRLPSTIVIVALAGCMILGVGWVITRQVTSLLTELPNYQANIQARIRSLQELGSGSQRLERMFEELNNEFSSNPRATKNHADREAPGMAQAPDAVVMQPERRNWLERMAGIAGPAVEIGGRIALSLVLVVFMLVKREDLRNRFIRLVGPTRISSTTKAVDDAAHRISRYLVMQAVVNVSFGAVLCLGLFLIGVEYSILWGVLAALMRYVPYVGIWAVAPFPIILSFAMFSGWWPPVLVIGLFLALEIITPNVMEPWLFGQSMGVSEVALLLAAAFAAFLWGSVGLVLAAPLTVCLAVLGRFVPQLEFLEVLLGDEPALADNVSFYQRLLARDQDEAEGLVHAYIQNTSLERVYDDVLVPALTLAKRAHDRNELTDSDLEFIYQAMREIVEDLNGRLPAIATEESDDSHHETTSSDPVDRISIVACPARDEADRLVLEMLGQLLDSFRWTVVVTAVDSLAAEVVEHIAQEDVNVVCIGSLPAGGLAHTCYLCKRLRARLPNIKIIVGRWGLKNYVNHNHSRLRAAGADGVSTSLLEARNALEFLRTVLACQREPARPQRLLD